MRPQPLIVVKDIEASSRFYERLLGCKSAHGKGEHEEWEYDRLVDPKLHHTVWSEPVTHFAGFAALPQIKKLWGVSGAFKSFDGLEHCKQLELASFPSSDKMAVKTVAPLAGMTKLKKLSVRGCKQLANIDDAVFDCTE